MFDVFCASLHKGLATKRRQRGSRQRLGGGRGLLPARGALRWWTQRSLGGALAVGGALSVLALGCSGSSSPGADGGAQPGSDGGGQVTQDGGGDGGITPPVGARENPCDAPRSGPVLYVTEDGDDGGNCTEGAPCETIQRAADLATAVGTIVRVSAGTYGGFHTVHPGVIFEADGQVEVHSGNDHDERDIISVYDTDDVVIDGFHVRDAERAGIAVLDSDDVIVCNNIVGPNGRWGIFTGFTPRVVIFANETFGSADEHGIYVSNSEVVNDAPVVYGNLVHDNVGNGIQLNGDCQFGGDGMLEDAVIEANWVYDNGLKGLSIIAAPRVLIANNVIHDNGPAAGGIHLTNEPGCDDTLSSSGGVIVNNTVIEPDIAALRATDAAVDNVIFNNIFGGPKGAIDETSGNDFGDNLSIDDASDLFVGDSYELSADSAARDTAATSYAGKDAPTHAIDGTLRPQGTGVDYGAFEAAE